MSSRNVMVRVSPETRTQLNELVETIELAVSKGKGKRFWSGDKLTLAELVGELVARELAHRARSRASAAKRKNPPPAAKELNKSDIDYATSAE